MKTKKNTYDKFRQNTPAGFPANQETDISYDPMSDLIRDMDVRTTVESLPELEKNICLMLMAGEKVNAICRELKISAHSFWNKHIPIIRNRFLEYGFEQNEIYF